MASLEPGDASEESLGSVYVSSVELPDGWEDAVTDGAFYAYIVVGDTIYEEISAPKISMQTAPSTLSVGNVCSKSLEVSVLTQDTFDASVPIEVYAKATTDGSTFTEAVSFGEYYIDTQARDCMTNLVTLTCYDAMLKSDATLFDEDGTCTQVEAVEAAAQKLGISIDSATYNALHSEYAVIYEADDSIRTILGYVAACHGGNFFISAQNLLTLQTYDANPTSYTLSETAAILGTLSISWKVYVCGLTASNGETDYTYNESDDAESVIVGALAGSAIVGESVVGNAATEVDKLATFDLGACPYMTNEIFENLCSQMIGYTYTGFTATSCVIDPTVKPGNRTIVGGFIDSATDVINVTLTLNLAARCDIGAPDLESLQSEYPYLN